MFTTLDEVIARWKERYEEVSFRFNLLPGEGYSEAEIQSVEEHIGVPLHPSLKSILQQVNLDTVSFRGLMFGGVRDLIAANIDEDFQFEGDDVVYLNIGGGEYYIIIMNNQSGHVLAVDHEDVSFRIHVANNFEAFFLTAASVVDIKHPDFKTRDEAESYFSQQFDEWGLDLGRKFWLQLPRYAA